VKYGRATYKTLANMEKTVFPIYFENIFQIPIPPINSPRKIYIFRHMVGFFNTSSKGVNNMYVNGG
jgi:hypothetical protein